MTRILYEAQTELHRSEKSYKNIYTWHKSISH